MFNKIDKTTKNHVQYCIEQMYKELDSIPDRVDRALSHVGLSYFCKPSPEVKIDTELPLFRELQGIRSQIKALEEYLKIEYKLVETKKATVVIEKQLKYVKKKPQ